MRFLRNLLLEDAWLKLFSLALAVLTWVTVWFAIQKGVSPVATAMSNLKDVTFFNLPVVVLSAAGDVHAFKVDPKEVQVTVQGETRVLGNLKSRDIRVMVDLTGVEPVGDVRKRIEISTPPGVTHVRVVPQDVLVIFPAKL